MGRTSHASRACLVSSVLGGYCYQAHAQAHILPFSFRRRQTCRSCPLVPLAPLADASRSTRAAECWNGCAGAEADVG